MVSKTQSIAGSETTPGNICCRSIETAVRICQVGRAGGIFLPSNTRKVRFKNLGDYRTIAEEFASRLPIRDPDFLMTVLGRRFGPLFLRQLDQILGRYLQMLRIHNTFARRKRGGDIVSSSSPSPPPPPSSPAPLPLPLSPRVFNRSSLDIRTISLRGS